jgi:hypothetical protein
MAVVEPEVLPPTREANEVLASLAEGTGRVAPLAFLCECPDRNCMMPVPLDLGEYRALRHVWAPVRGHPGPPGVHRS